MLQKEYPLPRIAAKTEPDRLWQASGGVARFYYGEFLPSRLDFDHDVTHTLDEKPRPLRDRKNIAGDDREVAVPPNLKSKTSIKATEQHACEPYKSNPSQISHGQWWNFRFFRHALPTLSDARDCRNMAD